MLQSPGQTSYITGENYRNTAAYRYLVNPESIYTTRTPTPHLPRSPDSPSLPLTAAIHIPNEFLRGHEHFEHVQLYQSSGTIPRHNPLLQDIK